MVLLARNEEINRWLDQHPAVLGGGAIVLGLVLLGFGVTAILTGRSRSKWGTQLEGPMAHLHGAIMAVAGLGCCAFGLFKLATGMLS